MTQIIKKYIIIITKIKKVPTDYFACKAQQGIKIVCWKNFNKFVFNLCFDNNK